MSFLGTIFKAATSVIPGGSLVKGALGLAGDIIGGSGGGTKASSSGSQSQSTTQQTQLRDWTPQEQIAYNNAMAGLAAAGQPMTPEAEAAMRDKIYQANYNPAATAIKSGLETAQADTYANAARRGASQTSTTGAASATNDAVAARELGLASSNATIAAENAFLAEQQRQQQAAAQHVATLNSLWSARLQGSKIVNSSSGSTSANESSGGGSFGERLAQGVGYALGNKDSYLNTSIFGSKSKSTDSAAKSTGKKTTGGLGLAR